MGYEHDAPCGPRQRLEFCPTTATANASCCTIGLGVDRIDMIGHNSVCTLVIVLGQTEEFVL